MKLQLKHLTSLFLLMAVLWPSLVKLGHHHEHPVANSNKEVAVHEFQEKCAVCNFEFSVFTDSPIYFQISGIKPDDHYRSDYISPDYSSLSRFSFMLRGPPLA